LRWKTPVKYGKLAKINQTTGREGKMKVFSLFVCLWLTSLLFWGLSPVLNAEGAGITPEDIAGHFKNEPSIEEIQEAAIEYAEVQPEKIASWRKKAAVKALFPELSLDYDKTIYGSATSETIIVGPYDWGIRLKWDLGDIVWNPSQTSIDVRSRLMVKLRNDILEEVNKLYFKRRKIQLELLLNPPQNTNKRLEKELQIEELTGGIDGLTGGYLSWSLKRM